MIDTTLKKFYCCVQMNEFPHCFGSGEGRHSMAAFRQMELYRTQINDVRKEIGAVNILDFGCGPVGTGRVFIESAISNTTDTLTLFDPDADILPPHLPNVSISGTEDVLGPNAKSFNIVNISYVLCLLEEKRAQSLLETLRELNPDSTFIIIDYILKGRSNNEVLRILTSQKEREWIEKMGQEEFCRTHCRFSMEDLQNLLKKSGLTFSDSDTQQLDDRGYRAAIVARR